MGEPLPIPFEAIERWAARFGPDDPDDFEEFLMLVTALDEAWLKAMAKPKPKGNA